MSSCGSGRLSPEEGRLFSLSWLGVIAVAHARGVSGPAASVPGSLDLQRRHLALLVSLPDQRGRVIGHRAPRGQYRVGQEGDLEGDDACLHTSSPQALRGVLCGAILLVPHTQGENVRAWPDSVGVVP